MIAALAFLKSAWGFAKLVPWWVYALIVAVGYHLISLNLAVHSANVACDKKWTVKIAEQKAAYDKQINTLKTKQQEVVTKTVIQYRDRVKIIKEKGDDIVKEIEVLVPLNSPLLSGGVRVAHDSAASGDMPNDPVGAAGAAAPVEAATLLSGVAQNYTDCRAEYQKLVSLQTLVKSLEGVKP